MSHSYQMSGRSGNHVDFFIRSGEFFFQNDHGKYRSSCGNVTCTNCNTVCGNHTCSCITFRRAHRDSCFQFTCHIQKFRTFFCKNAGIFPCNKSFRHNVTKFPRESVRCYQFIEFINHFLIIICFCCVNREHTRRITDSKNSLTCQFPVYISLQSCDIVNIFYMFFTVKDRLIQMSNAPSLRNVVVEQFHQFLAGFSCNVVSPCTEWYKKFSFFVKWHISMHHGADAKCTYGFQFYVIFCFYILCHILIAVLDTCPDIIQTVCPDTVFITVFPFMCTGCDWLIFVIYKYCFDSGRTKFNTKRCFVSENRCFCFCYSHFYVPPCFSVIYDYRSFDNL